MITVRKESVENKSNPVYDAAIGLMGIYRHSDVFYKKDLPGRKGNPDSHEFDERLINAAEFIYALFSILVGEKARPFFYDTVRLEGDSNYYVSNKPSKGLSKHSQGLAGDLNWKDQLTEDKILHIISHDVRNRGVVWQKLTSMGVGGIGTYFRSSFGTFLHLDTGPSRHWDKYSNVNKIEARKAHEAFMGEVAGNPRLKEILYVSIPIVTEPIQSPDIQESENTDDPGYTSEGSSLGLAALTDLLTSVTFLWEESEEDPMKPDYRKGQRVLQVVSVISALSVFIALYYYFNIPKL